jgi:hypothetical protein
MADAVVTELSAKSTRLRVQDVMVVGAHQFALSANRGTQRLVDKTTAYLNPRNHRNHNSAGFPGARPPEQT